MGMLKILKGKNKKNSKSQYISDTNSFDITKKQYKEIKKRACPWKFCCCRKFYYKWLIRS